MSNLLGFAGRTAEGLTFAPQEWRILNVIHATARAARLANNMAGLRNALQRYREAAKAFLGIQNTNDATSNQPAAGEGERSSAA